MYLFFYVIFSSFIAFYSQIYGFYTDGITCNLVLLAKKALPYENIEQEQRPFL